MPSIRVIIILALLASAAAVAGSVRPGLELTASALPVPDPSPVFTYVDDLYGFSFENASDLALSVFEDSQRYFLFGDTPDGDTVLLIAIGPYVLDEPLTEELLRAEVNSGDISSPIESRALPSGPTSLVFRRSDTPMGATQDALFVHRRTRYQVSVIANKQHLLDRILETWTFAN